MYIWKSWKLDKLSLFMILYYWPEHRIIIIICDLNWIKLRTCVTYCNEVVMKPKHVLYMTRFSVVSESPRLSQIWLAWPSSMIPSLVFMFSWIPMGLAKYNQWQHEHVNTCHHHPNLYIIYLNLPKAYQRLIYCRWMCWKLLELRLSGLRQVLDLKHQSHILEWPGDWRMRFQTLTSSIRLALIDWVIDWLISLLITNNECCEMRCLPA